MPLNNFKVSEYVYRGVICSPTHCKLECNPIIYTSAVFKDSRGVSVDFGCGRSDEEVIKFMIDSSFNRNKPFRAILKISVSYCYELGAIVIPKPLEDGSNPYHAEIHLSNTQVPLTSSLSKKMATNSVAIYHCDENCK